MTMRFPVFSPKNMKKSSPILAQAATQLWSRDPEHSAPLRASKITNSLVWATRSSLHILFVLKGVKSNCPPFLFPPLSFYQVSAARIVSLPPLKAEKPSPTQNPSIVVKSFKALNLLEKTEYDIQHQALDSGFVKMQTTLQTEELTHGFPRSLKTVKM